MREKKIEVNTLQPAAMAWLSASADPLGALMTDHLLALRLPTPAELHLSVDRVAFMRFLSDDDALRVLAAFEDRTVNLVGLKPSPSLGLLVRLPQPSVLTLHL